MPFARWRVLVLALTLLPSAARAEDEQAFGLGISFGSDLPLSALAELQVDLPGRFHVSLGSGRVPAAFRSAISDVGQRAELWSREEAEIIADDGKGSRVLSASFGYRPLRGRGLVVEAEWSHVQLTITGEPRRMMQVFASGKPSPRRLGAELSDLEARITVAAVGARVGWEWRWGAAFARLTAGGRLSIHTATGLFANWDGGEQTPVDLFGENERHRVETNILRYGRVPSVSLRVGALLF